MAEKRSFAKDVVISDEFIDMDDKTKYLYFMLGMFADDDGFVNNPKSITRMCGASQENIDELVNSNYLIIFPSGIIVIRHWKINNYIPKDRYKITQYIGELSTLDIDKYGAYIESKELNSDEDDSKMIDEQIERPTKALRRAVKRASELPVIFEQVIRNAFNGEICPICGDMMTYVNAKKMPTIQHNTPISKGGLHELDNISVICRSCNTSLQDKVETPPYNTEKVKEIWEEYLSDKTHK